MSAASAAWGEDKAGPGGHTAAECAADALRDLTAEKTLRRVTARG